MAGAYQAVVVVTAGFATMARTRMPERAASTQALAVVNMGVREPQVPRSVNAINGCACRGGGDGARRPCRSLAGVSDEARAVDVRPPTHGNVVTRVEPGIPARKPNGGDCSCPCPAPGRVFRAGRRVRLGDVDPTGRLRLDVDRPLPAGRQRRRHRRLPPPRRPGLGRAPHGHRAAPPGDARRAPRAGHLLLRLRQPVGRAPGLDPGRGGRASIDAVTVWVHVDPATGRPKSLSPAVPRPLRHRRRPGARSWPARSTSPSTPWPTASTTFPWQPARHRPRRPRPRQQRHGVGGRRAAPGPRSSTPTALGAAVTGRRRSTGPFRAEVEFRDAVERSVGRRRRAAGRGPRAGSAAGSCSPCGRPTGRSCT